MRLSRRNKATLLRAHNEQEGLCFYCHKRTWLPWEAPGPLSQMATREHLVRRVDGGNDRPENLTMACADCNSRRRYRTPEEWIAARSGGELPAEAAHFGGHEIETPDFDPAEQRWGDGRRKTGERSREADPREGPQEHRPPLKSFTQCRSDPET